MSSIDLSVIKDLISKDLCLTDEEIVGLELSDETLLRQNLIVIVGFLLNNDFNRLINACYRLDIPQEHFQKALETPNPSEIPSVLANMIIEREREKVVWRKKYKQE